MIQSVASNQVNGFWVSAKRTMVVASLYFRLAGKYNPDKASLEECNRLFYLVNRADSLLLPVMACRKLWPDKTVNEAVSHHSEGRHKMAAEALYGKVPSWLRYVDRELMLRDTERVLRKVDQLHGISC